MVLQYEQAAKGERKGGRDSLNYIYCLQKWLEPHNQSRFFCCVVVCLLVCLFVCLFSLYLKIYSSFLAGEKQATKTEDNLGKQALELLGASTETTLHIQRLLCLSACAPLRSSLAHLPNSWAGVIFTSSENQLETVQQRSFASGVCDPCKEAEGCGLVQAGKIRG